MGGETPNKQAKAGKGGIIPPVDKQWKPGQSGCPNGPPRAKTQFYRYLCKYLEMTAQQLKKLKPDNMTLSQRGALKTALLIAEGDWPRAKEVIERDSRAEETPDELIKLIIEYVQ